MGTFLEKINSMFQIFLKGRVDIVLLYFFIIYSFLNIYPPEYKHGIWFAPLSLALLISAAYLFNKIYDYKEDSITEKSWALKKKDIYLALVVALSILPLPIGIIIGHPIKPFVIMYFWGVLLYFFYSFPIGNFRFKKVFLIKNIFAAGAWYLSIIVLVSAYLEISSFQGVFFHWFYLFLLFLVYEIIWDIKDIKGDKASGVTTIPNKYGVLTTKVIVAALLVVIFISVSFDIRTIGFLSSTYLFLWLIFISERTPIFYYHLIIFGQIALLFVHIAYLR